MACACPPRSPLLLLLCAALVLPGCDDEDGDEGPEFFVSARLTTRTSAVDFRGAAELTIDDLGYTTCRGSNGEYGVSVRWASGVAALDTPIPLSQEVVIKTEAPGNPGVLIDDFFIGELRFSEVEMNFAGTFRADPKTEGEKAIVEVSSGEFLCPNEEGGGGEEGSGG